MMDPLMFSVKKSKADLGFLLETEKVERIRGEN